VFEEGLEVGFIRQREKHEFRLKVNICDGDNGSGFSEI
jgi:predicted ATPase